MINSEFRISVRSPQDISANVISAWLDLEARALEANAFLSPLFVLPAIKYLDPDKDIFVVLVEKVGAGASDLLGVGVFRERIASRQLPLPHVVAYKSIHSYLSGLLVDKDYTDEVLTLLFEFILSKKRKWHGLQYEMKAADGELSNAEHAVAKELGIKWTECSRSERSILVPAKCDESILSDTPKKFRKNHERCMRRLKELGTEEWHFIRNDNPDHMAIDNFLRLENMGWKQQAGTSLGSNSSHASFFQEMIKGFQSQGRAFFTELSLNDEVIASTSNLISGNTGFAFKIGWNTEYAKLSPGILNEVLFIKHCKDLLQGLDFIDSCASEESFINSIWPWQRKLVSGVYATTRLGNVVAKNRVRIRKIFKKADAD